jgi:hypothetical protein
VSLALNFRVTEFKQLSRDIQEIIIHHQGEECSKIMEFPIEITINPTATNGGKAFFFFKKNGSLERNTIKWTAHQQPLQLLIKKLTIRTKKQSMLHMFLLKKAQRTGLAEPWGWMGHHAGLKNPQENSQTAIHSSPLTRSSMPQMKILKRKPQNKQNSEPPKEGKAQPWSHPQFTNQLKRGK